MAHNHPLFQDSKTNQVPLTVISLKIEHCKAAGVDVLKHEIKKNRSQNIYDSGARIRGGRIPEEQRKQKPTHQGQLS